MTQELPIVNKAGALETSDEHRASTYLGHETAAMKAVEGPAPIQRMLEDLEDALTRHAASLDNLAEHLDPILIQSEPAASDQLGLLKSSQPHSPLAFRLMESVEVVERLTAHAHTLNARAQL